jgi:hypothetical protein
MMLSPDALMARAREITGVDLIDEAVIEPLIVLHRSINEEGGLHARGVIAKQNKLLRLLCNRLRMLRDFKKHPEIAEQRIERPLFVIGAGRSGTTKTQKMLSATGDFNFLPFWQAFNQSSFSGVPNESTDERIRESDNYCRWFDIESPDTKCGHSFETHEPEEDTVLTEACFAAPSFIGYSECTSYMTWLAQQNPTVLFEFLRDVIKYLQWQGLASADRRWLLKAPTYYGFESVILSVFPDADFVMTHRSPLQTVPSSCKLITEFRKPFSTAPVDTESLCVGFAMMIDLHLANRKNLPDFRLLDVHFDDVSRDWDRVVEKIYAHIGLPLRDEARQRMADWSRDYPQHRYGPFRYSLAEFGLSEERIRRDMAGYFDLTMRLFGK